MQEILQKLISYRTTKDNPEEIKQAFQYIASLFDPNVFEVKDFEKNGVYSQLISFKGKDALRPRILLNGHLDVVPADHEEQYEMSVEGTIAKGRGTSDMKGMIAVLIEVMRDVALRQAQDKTNASDIAMLLTADEEVGGENGVGYLVSEIGIKPQFVLCADGTHDTQEIVTREKGGVWVELCAQGVGAHAAYLWKGENAIEKLLKAIAKIKAFVGETEPEAWKSTCNIALIETSNQTPNKVPADARAVLDIRFTEELAKTPEELVEKLRTLATEITLAPLTKIPLLLVDEAHPLLREFQKIAEEVISKSIPFHFGHGATDARFFAEIGIPAVIFGAKGGNWHAAEEWVDLESLEKSKEILLRFLKS